MIPPLLNTNDGALIQANSGEGKSLAVFIPILNKIMKDYIQDPNTNKKAVFLYNNYNLAV